MRRLSLVVSLLLAGFTGCRRRSARVSAKNDPRAPLWYRDGGERCSWSHGPAKDPRKQKVLDEFGTELRQRDPKRLWNADIVARMKAFLRDDDEMVVLQAAFNCDRCRPDFLPELEAAHNRWPKNIQLERIFAKTAANCWSDVKLREYFWALPADTPKDRELHHALHRELARCGTLEDARKLEARLPAGADWRHDPVIARIRLHRSERPDKLAFGILAFLDERPMGTVHGHDFGVDQQRCCHVAQLYRSELQRYLTFGKDPRYRRRVAAACGERRYFGTDQETYPHELKEILKAWLERLRSDWERQILAALDQHIKGGGPAKAAKHNAVLAWDAIEIARLFTIRAAITRIKKVVSLGAEDNSLIRPAMRALKRLGVDDDYWLKCLSTKSRNGRDYVACGALCEVWDSKSPEIRSAIRALRKKLESSKDVDYSRGLPAVLHMLNSMETLEGSYQAARPKEQLKIIETALRRGESHLGDNWVDDYFGRPLDDYNYLRVRWGANRLREQAQARPEAVAKHIALLPHAGTKDLNVKKNGREGYRRYLLQWLGANMRDRTGALVKSLEAK